MRDAPRPVTDFFGTRLDPGALVAGLRALGLRRFALVLTDDGVVLKLAPMTGDAPDRAEAWLKGRFSPLMPCTVHAVSRDCGCDLEGSFQDLRRAPFEVVALAEVFHEKDLARAEAVLRARLGDAPEGEVQFQRWVRPGGESGVRPATIVAASRDAEALSWLGAALDDETDNEPAPPCELLLDGLEWGVARRPTVAALAAKGAPPVVADSRRCDDCGLCAKVCPVQVLDGKGRFLAGGTERCLKCFDCVEACPQDALRPAYSASSATTGRSLSRRPGWLSRLRGAAGPVLPAPFPPSFLLPKEDGPVNPRHVLGLAVTTQQEHAAALLDRGEISGAVEEERLSRVRHHGWKSKFRPGSTLASDPTLCLEEVLCRRAIGALLSPRGLTLDDMDLLAVNGLPARYRNAWSALDARKALPTLRSGRVVFVPHHLAHAASAWRASGLQDSFVLTADGRGDRETAAVFKASQGKIRQLSAVLSLSDRSIGGVYETVTRLLGFGPHGQGSVMALASFGRPFFDFTEFLSWGDKKSPTIHERGLLERFSELARRHGEPLGEDHKNLAASLQAALEKVLGGLLKAAGVKPGGRGLCLAGGVALNCRANSVLRSHFRPHKLFVPPGANDAGTALGAALEAAGTQFPTGKGLDHADLGPEFTDEEAEAALKHAGLPYFRAGSIAEEAAGLLTQGEVVCWAQGRAEFGPRALGHRSLLADPRAAEMHARVNRIKDRESWRPFGPSILSGHEKSWFTDAADAPFMVFSTSLKPGKEKLVPAVVHVDGTTRPQSVSKKSNPLYHALLSEFHKLTGVPMVLNTSFNRRGEPIVCTPFDAIQCFLAMKDADALALGPFIARHPGADAPRFAEHDDSSLAGLGGGRRLLLRLTAHCDAECAHCTLRDISQHPDRSFDDAVRSLAEGRRALCSELVILRGEAALWPGLPHLLRRARTMGYSFIQFQTGGHPLLRQTERLELLPLLDALEVTLYSADEAIHDALTCSPGSFRQTVLGARAAVTAGRQVVFNVPVLRANHRVLNAVSVLAAKLGARRVQFVFPRPVETVEGLEVSALARLSAVSPYIREALRAAARAGIPSSTEAVPFCHLDPDQRSGPDSSEDWRRFRIDDLDRLQESLDPSRPGTRPESPACRSCSARPSCPRTWALYLALFGSSELTAL